MSVDDAPSVAQRGALNNSWRRKGCCFCRLVELGKLTLLLWYLLSCVADGGGVGGVEEVMNEK